MPSDALDSSVNLQSINLSTDTDIPNLFFKISFAVLFSFVLTVLKYTRAFISVLQGLHLPQLSPAVNCSQHVMYPIMSGYDAINSSMISYFDLVIKGKFVDIKVSRCHCRHLIFYFIYTIRKGCNGTL